MHILLKSLIKQVTIFLKKFIIFLLLVHDLKLEALYFCVKEETLKYISKFTFTLSIKNCYSIKTMIHAFKFFSFIFKNYQTFIHLY